MLHLTSWKTKASVLCVAIAAQTAMAQDLKKNEADFNFVGADIEAVVKAIGHYTGTTFVVDPRVKGTINLVSEKPVTKAQAFQLLTSMLRLQGYSVVAAEGFTKVVPEADAKLQSGPIQAGKVHGDQIATQIFRLNYESAANMVPILRPLISANNTININPGNNSVVITDYADNLRRLGKIIAALDSPVSADPDVVPIRHAIASDIALMVNRLLESSGPSQAGAAGGTQLSVLADSRTNSVVVRAPSAARANLAKTLIAKFDQPTATPGNVHVIHLKNAEATKLALTLRAVIAADSSATGSSTPSTTQAGQGANASIGSTSSSSSNAGLQTPPSTASASQGPLSTGGPGGFIQADATTNTLIITANETMYRNLRAVIDQLDARRAQVYIESLIVEVSDTMKAELGVQWAGVSGNSNSSVRVGAVTGFSSGGDNLISQAVAKLSSSSLSAPSNGLSLAVFNQNGLGLLAHALASDSDTNILSMPNLVTLDNEEAKILVGSNVPFITGQYTTTGSSSSNPFQTVERKDIGVALRVRPQISEGGGVKMAIYQETSAITDTTNSAGLITSKRSIETNVLVSDGQLIVLGGLIGDDAQNSIEQVPGLSKLPVVGNLFKYRKQSRNKTNLMVFLRPTVIRTNEQSVEIAGDRYNQIREEQVRHQSQPVPLLPESGGPQLPPLENGRLQNGTRLNRTPANGNTDEVAS